MMGALYRARRSQTAGRSSQRIADSDVVHRGPFVVGRGRPL